MVCPRLTHVRRFGRNVFVGCVVTSAPAKGDVVENIVVDLSQ